MQHQQKTLNEIAKRLAKLRVDNPANYQIFLKALDQDLRTFISAVELMSRIK